METWPTKRNGDQCREPTPVKKPKVQALPASPRQAQHHKFTAVPSFVLVEGIDMPIGTKPTLTLHIGNIQYGADLAKLYEFVATKSGRTLRSLRVNVTNKCYAFAEVDADLAEQIAKIINNKIYKKRKLNCWVARSQWKYPAWKKY